jgi:hypothetical protein
MTELNVTLGIEGYSLDRFVQTIEEKLDIVDKIEEQVADKFDTIFEDTLDDKLSEKITDEVNNVVNDIIDDRIESKVGSEVEHYMQYEFDMNSAVQDAISDSDISTQIFDQIDDLLKTYNPGVACSVGDKFTKAVANAIHFIFEEQDEQTNRLSLLIKNAIDHAVSYEIVQKMKEDIIKEHNSNLSEYFKNVATNSQTTHNNPYTITNINTTYNQ